MDIFEGVMRIEIVEGSVSSLWGVIVSGFSGVVVAVGGSVEEDSVGGASVSEEEDEEVTAATGIVSLIVLGFCVLTCLSAWTIFPDNALIYVHWCPFISAISVNPPTEKRKNCLSNARAIDFPMLIFPTPGGPTRRRIFPCMLLRSLPIKMNSRMHVLRSVRL